MDVPQLWVLNFEVKVLSDNVFGYRLTMVSEHRLISIVIDLEQVVDFLEDNEVINQIRCF